MSKFPINWHAKPHFYGHEFAEQLSSMLWSVSENPHDSRTLWDIWIKLCLLIYFNTCIAKPLVCKVLTRVCPASLWLVKVLVKMLITLEPRGIL